jgi:hypothetical protein
MIARSDRIAAVTALVVSGKSASGHIRSFKQRGEIYRERTFEHKHRLRVGWFSHPAMEGVGYFPVCVLGEGTMNKRFVLRGLLVFFAAPALADDAPTLLRVAPKVGNVCTYRITDKEWS